MILGSEDRVEEGRGAERLGNPLAEMPFLPEPPRSDGSPFLTEDKVHAKSQERGVGCDFGGQSRWMWRASLKFRRLSKPSLRGSLSVR